MFDLKPLFFVLYRLTADFRCADDSQQNRLLDLKCHFKIVMPTLFRQGASGIFWSRIPPPCSGQGVRENSCFHRHFWTAPTGPKTGSKQPYFVQGISSPVSWTGLDCLSASPHRESDIQVAVQCGCDCGQVGLCKIITLHLVMKVLGTHIHSSGKFCFGDVATLNQQDSDFFCHCHTYHLFNHYKLNSWFCQSQQDLYK